MLPTIPLGIKVLFFLKGIYGADALLPVILAGRFVFTKLVCYFALSIGSFLHYVD